MRPKRRQTALEEIDDSNIHSLTPYIHFRWRRVRRPGRAGREAAGGAQEENAQRAVVGVAGEGQATGDRRVMPGAGSMLVERRGGSTQVEHWRSSAARRRKRSRLGSGLSSNAFASPTVGDTKKNILFQPLYTRGNFHLPLQFASLLWGSTLER